MSVTIFETLQNADFNFRNNGLIGMSLAKEQLHNAVVLLDKGYNLGEEIDTLLEKYDGVDNVPEEECN